MTPEEREKMNALCRQIQDEKDPKTFTELLEELNRLTESKRERFQDRSKS
jgi:hypothetical protein